MIATFIIVFFDTIKTWSSSASDEYSSWINYYVFLFTYGQTLTGNSKAILKFVLINYRYQRPYEQLILHVNK